MNDKQDISLSFYEEKHFEGLSAFKLPDEQKRFSALPKEVLSESISDESRYPIVIEAKDKPVGFFILHVGNGIHPYTENKSAILLRAFSINSTEQGKGYAKRAMNLVPSFVKKNFPTVDEIVLAVNGKNIAARQLYVQTGFQDNGLRREGSIGLQYILQFPIGLIT